MRRGNATISARQDMRYADALQTRSRENARCRVPRMVSRLSEGRWQHHKFETGAAAPMRTSPPGNRVRSEVGGTPNSATPPQRTRCIAVSPNC